MLRSFRWIPACCVVVLLSSVVFLMQTASAAQVDDNVQADGDVQAADDEKRLQPLSFVTTEFDDVREGYVTLEWDAIQEATSYEVLDTQGGVVYSGPLPQAFLSGMADGQYRFTVRALAGTGEVLAESLQPAQVTVNHWPMQYVATLFTIGLVVVLAVAVVIIRGASTVFQTEVAE